MNAHPGQLRQHHIELAKAHERLSTNQRQLNRPISPREIQQPVHERLPFEVRQFAQQLAAAEVGLAICIAAGAAQRTLPRDFD